MTCTTSSTDVSDIAYTIKPSKMEVAPLHRTVDIRQKRRLLKNTKETKKILEG